MRRLILIGLLALLLAAAAYNAPASFAASAPSAHRYQAGKNVRALQWLLGGHKPSVYRIQAFRYPVNGHYGRRTASAVHNMKWRLGAPTSSTNGDTAGPAFFDYLEGHKRPYQWKLRAGKRVIALQKLRYNLEHPPVSAKVALMVKDAEYLIANRGAVGYSQTYRMQIVRQRIALPPLHRFIWEDCSSSVTGLYWLAGLPDPNGLGYNGYGYTGTQSAHGRVVWRLGEPLSQLRPGDILFYGGGWPHHHETMYLGNGRVFSHGSSAGPLNLPALYRSDAVGAHRYIG